MTLTSLVNKRYYQKSDMRRSKPHKPSHYRSPLIVEILRGNFSLEKCNLGEGDKVVDVTSRHLPTLI